MVARLAAAASHAAVRGATPPIAPADGPAAEATAAARKPPTALAAAIAPCRARACRPHRASTSTRATPTTIAYFYDRYYDPWAYGAFGLGYSYSAWGHPYYPSPGYYPYYAGTGYGYQYADYDVGSVKIKVKPRDAEVYVDNYFAGYVDDFDGVFQALKVETGGHRIEVRKPGFETLQFDVHVQPSRSVTFRGEMKPTP